MNNNSTNLSNFTFFKAIKIVSSVTKYNVNTLEVILNM